ncbi:MAG: autotransporter outer membrane beta-barrel domain-containing protein [Planctomycetia bacterium]|nr:autotransporter outer membrane beta-barrel domain-containing protein [Planctomycetia bacterium]
MKNLCKILILFPFFLFIMPEQGRAQTLYSSAPQVGLTSATVENILLLQNMRDTDRSCIGKTSWALGYGSGGYTHGETDISQNFGGFLVGTDLNIGIDSRVGAFFAFNASEQLATVSENNVLRGEENDTNHYFWGFYGRKDYEYCYFLGTAALGYAHTRETLQNTATSSTSPTFPDSVGKSDTFRAFLYGEIGTEFRFGSFSLQPFWGLQYYYSDFSSMTLSDSTPPGALPGTPGLGNLNLGSAQLDSLRNIIALRLAHTFLIHDTETFSLHCTGFWYHEFLDGDTTGNGLTPNIGRDWAALAPTVEWQRGNLKLWAGYLALFNDRTAQQLGHAGVAFCW